jgi:hypothetical protein
MQLSVLLRRLPLALLLSIALNVLLFAVDSSIDPRQEELSQIQLCVVSLLKPAVALVTWLAPGHGGVQIFYGVLFSVVVYTVVIWLALSLPVWWRRRA